MSGYKNALIQRGVPVCPTLIKKGDLTPQSGYRLAKELLQEEHPTSIFAANDLMAFGAIRASNELGLTVPEDLAIVGFDNIPFSAYFEPSLTTVEIPMYHMGAAAMDMLVNLISKKNGEKERWFNTRLLVRESTAEKRVRGKKYKLLDKHPPASLEYGKPLP